jgi:hypothetical protein
MEMIEGTEAFQVFDTRVKKLRSVPRYVLVAPEAAYIKKAALSPSKPAK